MSEPHYETVELSTLEPDSGNARERSARARATLARSIRQFGGARSAVIDGTGTIRAGHGTIEAAAAAGLKGLVVDVPEGHLLIARKSNWSEAQAKAYTLADNQTNDLAENDTELLVERLVELHDLDFELTETGFSDEEIDQLLNPPDPDTGEDESDERPGDLFGPWESDNEWDIPTLLLNLQANALPSPIMKWGTRRRKNHAEGSYHFYTDDYKFWGLHKNPQVVVSSGVKTVVEPNYTTTPEMSRAEALWWIYSKRVIARWWQSRGLRVLVDLNVDRRFWDLMLLGVPLGWRAYSTRWQKDDDLAILEDLHDRAVGRAQSEDLLFVVFGGGAKVRNECDRRGWGHVPEDSDSSRGRV